MKALPWLIWLAVAWLAPVTGQAHEMRPAFLSLQQTGIELFQVLWKVPATDDRRLALYARLPDTCTPVDEAVQQIDGGAYTERWIARCPGGLNGTTISIDGLTATMTDVLLRIAYSDGATEVARLTPEQPTAQISGAQSGWQIGFTYLMLGMDHILFGFDHLVFVLALILLIKDRRMLLKTITAFTLAHSLTLAGVTLGLFSLPQQPVEAAIALSIAFVARELVLMRQGEMRLSTSMPWLVAFAFGLLHGFGFAGALRETGLPQSDVPLALLTFNIGVEAGQLVFVAGVLTAFLASHRWLRAHANTIHGLAVYGIGTASIVWLISRFAGFALPA